MHKITFVVEFEDGESPSVSSNTGILGGKLVAVQFDDAIEQLDQLLEEIENA